MRFLADLPGIASILERRLARAQEMAADEAAAHVVGDPSRVAELLIRLARLQSARSAAAVAWLGSDLEARVRDLLHTGRRPDYPSAALLLGAAAAAVILGLLGAHQIHSDAEFLLKVLGR